MMVAGRECQTNNIQFKVSAVHVTFIHYECERARSCEAIEEHGAACGDTARAHQHKTQTCKSSHHVE